MAPHPSALGARAACFISSLACFIYQIHGPALYAVRAEALSSVSRLRQLDQGNALYQLLCGFFDQGQARAARSSKSIRSARSRLCMLCCFFDQGYALLSISSIKAMSLLPFPKVIESAPYFPRLGAAPIPPIPVLRSENRLLNSLIVESGPETEVECSSVISCVPSRP
ncbi:hypothetical protein MRB53_036342 [Persea americana]|nr:hypothetical protein MRB53_036342 [Persea americana]